MKQIKNKQIKNGLDQTKNIKWIEIINLILAVLAIIISIFIHIENMGLQKQYYRINTYSMNLNYKIKLLNPTKEGDVFLEDKKIKINTPSHIGILPKVGGIQKLHIVHYHNDNLIEEFPIDMADEGAASIYDAQKGSYNFGEYTIDILDEDENNYYSTLYLIIEDYNHNIFTNMLVYEISKENMSNIEIRVYDKFNIVFAYNTEDNYTNLSDFDISQIKEYQTLQDRIDKIL
jgi:hypothetical protein